ncbi:MAG: D-alanine--D-alanine ligase [Nitrospina sp.]|nr:MAG: D-alanine--D-alanine ligase [Nitrospina sp.]
MERFENKTIGVLMGGLSAERDISLTTGKEIHAALQRKGLNSVMIDVDRNIAMTLQKEKIDLAFIGLHGTCGEDGTIQGLLETAGIPFTGSGVLGSAIAYNKVTSKMIFNHEGIPTAPYRVLTDRDQPASPLQLPVVVKPADQGSSLGISIVKNKNEWPAALDLARRYSNEILVEQFIDGKLLAIGMNSGQPLPIVEVRPKSGFYDYESKYTVGKTEYICPADLSEGEKETCRAVAVQVTRALKGRGFPRVDVILSADGVPYVLEMNTIPGMTPTSLLPMAAKQAGMEFDELVLAILKTALLDHPFN